VPGKAESRQRTPIDIRLGRDIAEHKQIAYNSPRLVHWSCRIHPLHSTKTILGLQLDTTMFRVRLPDSHDFSTENIAVSLRRRYIHYGCREEARRPQFECPEYVLTFLSFLERFYNSAK